MKNRKIILHSLLLTFAMTVPLSASAITPEMRSNAEKVIEACETSYQNVLALRKKFDEIKKPSLLSSAKTKKIYKEMPLNKKVFEKRFEEFTNFTNEKIQIRTAKTPSQLRDLTAAYSSNCARFSSGLAGFVEWATTGEGKSSFSAIYNDWKKEVANEK